MKMFSESSIGQSAAQQLRTAMLRERAKGIIRKNYYKTLLQVVAPHCMFWSPFHMRARTPHAHMASSLNSFAKRQPPSHTLHNSLSGALKRLAMRASAPLADFLSHIMMRRASNISPVSILNLISSSFILIRQGESTYTISRDWHFH